MQTSKGERERIVGPPPIARGKGQVEGCKKMDLDIFHEQVIQRGASGLVMVCLLKITKIGDNFVDYQCGLPYEPFSVQIFPNVFFRYFTKKVFGPGFKSNKSTPFYSHPFNSLLELQLILW